MSKSTNEQVEKSRSTKIVKSMNIEELFLYIQQEDKDGGKRRIERLLDEHYRDAVNSESRTAYSSRVDFFDRLLGKPKESKDITTGGQPLNSVVFDILDNDNNKGE
jgi:hypothetical protein